MRFLPTKSAIAPALLLSMTVLLVGCGGLDADDLTGTWECDTSNPDGTTGKSVFTFRPDGKLYLDTSGTLVTGNYSILDESNLDIKFVHMKSVQITTVVDYDAEIVIRSISANTFSFDITTHMMQTNTRGNICTKRS